MSAKKDLSRREMRQLMIGALGIVFGDIGTSPLYAIKECFHPSHGIALSAANVYGILSLVFWSLTLVVTLKYLVFILRADNKGEGGIMALLALISPAMRHSEFWRRFFIMSGLGGAALLYGDGVITPAISVLSAVEGLQIAAPAFGPWVVPTTVAILLGLFSVQSRGTAHLGAIFGPATLLWFVTLAAIGVPWIMQHPSILVAVNPLYAVEFFINNGLKGFFILSAVVLCITGAEALYADMGHFGKKPIRSAWYFIVLPSLIINYFGQGALILEQGESVLHNPFFSMVSGWALYPLVAIATLATVIAAQALISGAFSLTQQAVQLGYLPRVTITHTSRSTEGQIYVPRVNSLLMVSSIGLVLLFRESSALASAYGIAVSGTMVITSLLFFAVAHFLWRWPTFLAVTCVGFFLLVDLAFFSANMPKFIEGGWIPMVIGGLLLALMTTWKSGRLLLAEYMLTISKPLSEFFEEIRRRNPPRVPGTAIFMTLTSDIAPSVLLHHFEHNKVLHERVVLLSIITRPDPEVDLCERVRVTDLELGFVKVIASYGYIERPDVTQILELCEGAGLQFDRSDMSFYLGRETFLTSGHSHLSPWRKKLFVLLSRNARPATEFFNIPADRVIELGSQIRI